MELIKDYDCVIYYHPGNANVVADALSRKSVQSTTSSECSFVIIRRWCNSDGINGKTKYVKSSAGGTKE